MTTFRTFLNTDPPKIVELWNRVGQSRGFGRLSDCDNLEQLIFSKPYFDRKGLHLAFDGDQLIGFCHAGFGSDFEGKHLDKSMGTIAMLVVDPSRQRQGIGSQLLVRGLNYLREQGSTVLYLGCLNPVNPFYLGMYGGSELPGVLESDESMSCFAIKHGFKRADTAMVYQLNLDELKPITDSRVPLLRRQVEVQVEPFPLPLSWWHAATMGPMVTLGYEMHDKASETQIGRAWVWEMETFSRAWGVPCVGLTDVFIHEAYRRQGYGRLMLHSILKHLHGQKIALVEVQTMSRNTAARGMYESLGFSHVDTGHIYRLGAGPTENTDLQDTGDFPAGTFEELDDLAETQEE